MDRHLKSNADNTRTHSLFRQGMPERDCGPGIYIIERFGEIVIQNGAFAQTVPVVANTRWLKLQKVCQTVMPLDSAH
jgi:hypothetical protein